jgi:hypothetical protein
VRIGGCDFSVDSSLGENWQKAQVGKERVVGSGVEGGLWWQANAWAVCISHRRWQRQNDLGKCLVLVRKVYEEERVLKAKSTEEGRKARLLYLFRGRLGLERTQH